MIDQVENKKYHTKFVWTKEADARLLKLRENPLLTHRMIGLIFGVTKGAIESRLRRIRITRSIEYVGLTEESSVVSHPPKSKERFMPKKLGTAKCCQWIIKDGRSPLFCEDDSERGYSYCSVHCKIAYPNFKSQTSELLADESLNGI